MKYIDSDKLIAEIERELSAHDKVDHLEAFEVGKAWNRGHRKALENIRSFITSLQQEKPEGDLEKDIDRYIRPKCNYFYQGGSGYVHEKDVKEIAQHFYNLGLNAKK